MGRESCGGIDSTRLPTVATALVAAAHGNRYGLGRSCIGCGRWRGIGALARLERAQAAGLDDILDLARRDLLGGGQEHRERGPLAQGRPDLDRPAVLVDDPMGDRHAQAGALRLGRVERDEQLLQLVARDARCRCRGTGPRRTGRSPAPRAAAARVVSTSSVPPSGIAWTAFWPRFRNTCCSDSGSPAIGWQHVVDPDAELDRLLEVLLEQLHGLANHGVEVDLARAPSRPGALRPRA